MQSDVAIFRTLLDTEINSWLEQSLTRYAAVSQVTEVQSILTHLLSVSQGGKRIRPFLLWSVYHHYQPEKSPADILPLLLAVELFHIFCLIHDDVMDEASMRHGVPTIHNFAENTYYTHTNGVNPKRVADNQAILTGDILFNSVHRLLNEFRANTHSSAEAACDVFSSLIDEVCIGQMIDVHLTSQSVVSATQIEQKNLLKTAYYTFVRPLHLGAVVSGRPSLIPFVQAFGEQLGLLFQLQDDLLDVTGDPKNTMKPSFQDVSQNQHTLLTAFIREQGGEAAILLDSLSGKPLTATEQTALKAAFVSSGAIAYAEEKIAAYEATALALMHKHQLEPAEVELFSGLLALLTKRTS
jgi:geranylgeranyl diphosphate synthase type I